MSWSTTGSTSSNADRWHPEPGEAAENPCLGCGACCARFRVSFYWSEADDAPGGWVPHGLTVQVSPHLRAMRGTEAGCGRCVALEGEVGARVACRIYARRPSPCRQFGRHGEGGDANPRCNAARAAHGLPPLPDPVQVHPLAA